MVEYLFLAASFNKYSGPNNHLLDLCNYLHTESKKSLVLLTHSGVVESDFLRNIRFPTIRVLKRARYMISNVRAIRDTVKKLSPKIMFVNCDINLAFQAYFAMNKQLLIGYNVFGRPGEIFFDKRLAKSVYLHLLHTLGSRMLVKKIAVHTDFQRNLYVRLGVAPSKISVIPHCVDLHRLYRSLEPGYEIKKEVPVIMFVGGIKKVKGIIELLRTYEQISRKIDVHLLVVGRGPLERKVQEMKKHIERKNTKAKITYIKRVPLARLTSLMNSADVVAMPSYSEAFGLVAVEAMALKKAVLATCFGGISEVITNGIDGILVNPFNSHELQSRLEELILEPVKRGKLGKSAYQTIKNKYDVSVVAPRFIKFLEEP